MISCTKMNLSTEKDIIPSPVEIIKSDGLFTFKSGMSLYISDKNLAPAHTLLQNSLEIDLVESHEELSASIV